ncbi:MAG: hypothetical protein U1E73_14125 [Planctomycetota bacterium]
MLAAVPLRELLAEVERRFGRVAGGAELDPDEFLRAHPDAVGHAEVREARADLTSADANRRRRGAWVLRVELRRTAFDGPLRRAVQVALGVETDPAARWQLELLVAESMPAVGPPAAGEPQATA